MDRPARYRKKPVEVDALQWTGSNWEALERFAGAHVRFHGGDIDVWIEKSNTWRQALPVGDWVIGERDGVGFYPCTKEQFPEIHEPVDS